jgi:uncharacterized protein
MKKFNLTAEELEIVKQIFKYHPNTLLFGSRTDGTNKKFSDLDVCLKDNVDSYEYELLKEKLENTDLPFKVDLIEYSRLADSFKKIIDQQGVSLF